MHVTVQLLRAELHCVTACNQQTPQPSSTSAATDTRSVRSAIRVRSGATAEGIAGPGDVSLQAPSYPAPSH